MIDHLTAALADPIAIAGSCGIELGSQDWRSIFGAGGDRPAIHRAGAVGLVREVRITRSLLEIRCSAQRVAEFLGLPAPADDRDVMLTSNAVLRRSGQLIKLVRSNGMPLVETPNTALVRLVALAHHWWGEVRRDNLSVRELAQRVGVVPAYATRVMWLAFLSPKVTDAILASSANAMIGCRVLTRPEGAAIIDKTWREQERILLAT